MKLNLKIPYIQVKRPIKINQQKVCKTRTQKITAKELYKSKEPVNKKKKGHKTVINLFRDSPHPDSAS